MHRLSPDPVTFVPVQDEGDKMVDTFHTVGVVNLVSDNNDSNSDIVDLVSDSDSDSENERDVSEVHSLQLTAYLLLLHIHFTCLHR